MGKTGIIYTVTLQSAVDRELTVPVMDFDSVLRATEARVDFGGKGFNVSRSFSIPFTVFDFLSFAYAAAYRPGNLFMQLIVIGTF